MWRFVNNIITSSSSKKPSHLMALMVSSMLLQSDYDQQQTRMKVSLIPSFDRKMQKYKLQSFSLSEGRVLT